MTTEEFLDVAMSLGEGVPTEAKIQMLLKLQRKENPEDWSCSYVAHVLSKLGYEINPVDVPQNYLNVGKKVKKGEESRGDIVIYNNGKGIKVGFLYKIITEELPQSKDNSKEKDNKGKLKELPKFINKFIIVTSDDANAIIKEIVDEKEVTGVVTMSKIKGD